AGKGRLPRKAQSATDIFEGLLTEVEGAVDPAAALAHARRLDFLRVEHEEPVGAGLRLEAVGRNDCAARFGYGHYHFGVDMGPVLVVGEVCAQQTEAGHARGMPISGGVCSPGARHTTAILTNTARWSVGDTCGTGYGGNDDHSNLARLGGEFGKCGSIR